MQTRKPLALTTLDTMSKRAMCHYSNMQAWGKLMGLTKAEKDTEVEKRLKADRELYFGRKQER